MSNVEKPVVIDQYYCGGPKDCPIPDKNAVAISNVSYADIQGTYSNTQLSLACSEFITCKALTFTNINITPTPEKAEKPVAPFCQDAYGELSKIVIPPLKDCLLPPSSF
ncbi:hypothetical protein ACS0TY_028824 [Phlomoides rotata]